MPTSAPNKPIITLKKISTNATLSEETTAYSADLYVDGVKWGAVSNSGQGGSDRFHGVPGRSYDDLDALNKLIAITYPLIDTSDLGGDEPLTPCLETVCGELIEEAAATKALKSLLRRSVVYFEDGLPAADTLASLYANKMPATAPERLYAAIKVRYPKALILNELPFDQALVAYRRSE